MKIRNIAFAALMCLFLTGPALLYLATGVAKVDLPPWLTAQDATYYEGGVKNPDIAGNANLDGFASKELQSALEDAVGNNIPCKAHAMLGNAALQRAGIASSNQLFGWDAYPTFFGSDKVYLPNSDALGYRPYLKSQDTDNKLRTFTQGVTKVAQAYPDKRFVIYLPGGIYEPALSPVYNYLSNSLSLQELRDFLAQEMQDCSNVTVMADEYADYEDYYRNFWRTDHHWNSLGSVRAYNRMAEQLGLAPFACEDVVEIPIGGFSGRTAASALQMIKEPAFDLDYDFSSLRITSHDGTKVFDGNDHSLFWEMNPTLRQFEFNSAWLLSQETSRIEGPGAGHALLVSDSYGAGIQRLIGLQYAVTDIPWDLFNYEKGDGRLADYLTDDVSDVFLVAAYADFISIPERFPNYFDL